MNSVGLSDDRYSNPEYYRSLLSGGRRRADYILPMTF